MPRDASRTPTVSRLAARGDRSALHRKEMPGGGEVFTGDLASRSLRAMGARAMTVDRSIIVSDDFDPNRPEDQALFAHEQYHVDHSGGDGTSEVRDAEEIAARAIERMVLHQVKGGGSPLPSPAASLGPSPGGAPPGTPGSSSPPDTGAERASSAQRGYAALRRQGLTPHDIVDRLAREALQMLERSREGREERGGDKKGFL